MHFHTELTPETLPVPIQLNDQILTIGSCFAEVMGQQMSQYKLTVCNSPFGTVFNPVSISKLLLLALNGGQPDEALYGQRDGIWFHYDFHSSFWAPSRDELATKLNQRLAEVGDWLRQTNWLVLTLGTAMVYRHIETGQVVANCHKMPGQLFEKYLYAIDHVRETLTKLLKALRRANSKLRVVLTVSPVRHTRDTLPLNQASKSLLRVICHELTVWQGFVHYFPAYELLIDDLRDYRFYEADLIHPNAVAHAYIFQKFADSAFAADLRGFVAEWAGIQKALTHRPQQGMTESHRQFLTSLLARLEGLQDRVDVSAELTDVRGRLETILT